MTLFLASLIPSSLVFLVVVCIIFAAFIVLYALRSKGDVRAVMPHGKTVFTLEATEKKRMRQ